MLEEDSSLLTETMAECVSVPLHRASLQSKAPYTSPTRPPIFSSSMCPLLRIQLSTPRRSTLRLAPTASYQYHRSPPFSCKVFLHNRPPMPNSSCRPTPSIHKPCRIGYIGKSQSYSLHSRGRVLKEPHQSTKRCSTRCRGQCRRGGRGML